MTISQDQGGSAGTTTRVAATDASQALADAVILSGTTYAMYATITVQDNDIRIAFNATPTQVGNKVGHKVDVGGTILLNSTDQIRAFRFINDVNAANGILQVTVEF